MFRSLRAKVFAALVLILALAAALAMFFTRQDVAEAMTGAESRAARNVLTLIETNIAGRYKNLLLDKVRLVRDKKQSLEKLATLVAATLGQFAALADQGAIGEDEAKRRAAEWIGSLRLAGRDAPLAVAADGRVIAHPDRALLGAGLSHLRDLKGRPLIAAVGQDLRDWNSAFALFDPHPGDGLGEGRRFAHFSMFPRWGWMIGIVGHMDDIEKNAAAELARIVQVLRETLPGIQVVGAGYVFLFDGADRVLVAPPGVAESLPGTVDAIADRPLLAALREAAHRGGGLRYAPRDAPDAVHEAYVAYFKPLDWYMVTTVPVADMVRPAEILIAHLGWAFGGVLAFSLLLAWAFADRVARPLHRLADYAKALPLQDFSGNAPALSAVADLPAHSRDEVGRLAASFIFMEGALRENIRSLMETTRAKERVEGELNAARNIQMGILPRIFPPFPEREDFDLHAIIEPARAVGGDLYDFFMVDDNHLFFMVGDVSGKGVPAALFMAVTKTLFQTEAHRSGHSLDRVVAEVNRKLALDNPEEMFCTALAGVLDVRTGEVVTCDAGHEPAALARPDGPPLLVEKTRGCLALGVMPETPYFTASVRLQRGQTLVLYTDGVSEAMNPGQELFGSNRLLDTLARAGAAGARPLCEAVMADVKRHAGDEPQSDDITILALRWLGPPAGAPGREA